MRFDIVGVVDRAVGASPVIALHFDIQHVCRLLEGRQCILADLLLDPGDSVWVENPGYIAGYVPGVRENGGQYTHGAVWATMAFAALGDRARAWSLFEMINPVRHGDTRDAVARYMVEPYVVTADVYSVPPHTGRGGWSWYTGSAAWMQRAAIESMFGFAQEGDEISFIPCLPEAWKDAEITLTRGDRKLRVIFALNGVGSPAEQAAAYSAQLLKPGERLRWSALLPGACYLLLLATPTPAATASPTAALSQPG